jgi:hypothetical protein
LGKVTADKSSLNTRLATFNKLVLKSARDNIPRGKRRNYTTYWTQELDKLHKELSTRRTNVEDPTDQNVILHNKAKAIFTRKKNPIICERAGIKRQPHSA